MDVSYTALMGNSFIWSAVSAITSDCSRAASTKTRLCLRAASVVYSTSAAACSWASLAIANTKEAADLDEVVLSTIVTLQATAMVGWQCWNCFKVFNQMRKEKRQQTMGLQTVQYIPRGDNAIISVNPIYRQV